MFGNVTLIDLTHTLHPDIPTWDGTCGFQQEIVRDYNEGRSRNMRYQCHAGIGTHMDAPAHFIPHGATIADIPLTQLVVPLCMLDVSKEAHADFQITAKHIIDYEKKHGRIPKNCLFVGYTGWSKRWSHPNSFRNQDASGTMHFPTYHKDAADLLLERGIAGIGIDTLSPDRAASGYPVHHAILGAGKYILENLANMDAMPAVGGYVIALPIKIRDGVESAVRAIGVLTS